MNSWRDKILNEFPPGIARLTLVADPDGLLLEEGVYEGIRQRGFELMPYEEPVAFRYAYESRFRSRWEDGEEINLVVLLQSAPRDLDRLPYDLLQLGRKLSFSLGSLFPNLSYSVVATLDRSDLDLLFDAQMKYAPKRLGDNDTKEFILRRVFEIAPEIIKESTDLLRFLLRRHYRDRQVPAFLDEYLIQVIRSHGRFEAWPLEQIVPNREAFFAFLQERWPIFLDSLAEGEQACEAAPQYGLAFSGPSLLPFDHPDIRVYVDNLFLEGLLQPVEHPRADVLMKTSATSAAYGLKVSSLENRHRRAKGLLDAVEKMIPSMEARHGQWIQFALRWGELNALAMHPEVSLPQGFRERLESLRTRIDHLFTEWVEEHYASLINLPPVSPIMVHHIPRYLARAPHAKIAFILIDGLALDQWLGLREELNALDSTLRFSENAVFAWIPTVTSVSRQAAFAGKPPIYFPGSIHNTDKEGSLWAQFWLDQGLARDEVEYAKGGELSEVEELLSRPKLRVIGLVIDKVDRIMHGMEMGAAGMHNQVRQWSREGYLRDLLTLLHRHGYRVYLASDHGNIEAKGVGRPAEGALADQRGQRVRVYSDPKSRAKTKERFPDSVEWEAIGLPEDYFALLAKNRTAFIRVGDVVVCHGGITVEEVLVPFVFVDRKD